MGRHEAEIPENTLDFWAGYALNPEDRNKLETTIKELGGNTPLLKEVGSFRSADAKIVIFDLGGNVAEWADHNGTGKALGGSADLAAGERQQRAPAAEYIGFRVVSAKQSIRACRVRPFALSPQGQIIIPGHESGRKYGCSPPIWR